MINVKILSVGSFLPNNVVTNFDFESKIDTSDKWIKQRTGIHQRFFANNDETVVDMGYLAAKNALNNTAISLNEIDLIICATSTPDNIGFPSVACLIQNKLGIQKSITAFDINAACSGFIYALAVANSMLKSGNMKYALVIGADKMSSILDWKDRSTAVLFGDGAGAFLLQANTNDVIASTENNIPGIIDIATGDNALLPDILHTFNGKIQMNGREVFKYAVNTLTIELKTLMLRNGCAADNIKLIIPHQANYRILESVSEKLNIPYSKFVITVDKHANTSAASIPLALDTVWQQLKKGDLIILCAFGAGVTYGCSLIRL